MAPLEYRSGNCEASAAEGKERFDRSYSERREYESRVFRFQEGWMMKSQGTNVNAGVMGNEKPEPIVKEFWYSPRLGINVITKGFDPRASAVQNFVGGNLSQAPPNARLF